MKKSSLTLLATVAFILAIAWVARSQTNDRLQGAAPNAAIMAKLREIVTIRERQFESFKVLLTSGRAPMDDMAEIALVEAKLRLAREQRQQEAVAAELRNLVAAHQRRLKLVEAAARDRLPPGDADRVRADLLEAEIRLLREEK